MVQGTTPRYPNAVQVDGVGKTILWNSNTTHASQTDVVAFEIINNAGTYVVLGDIIGGYN